MIYMLFNEEKNKKYESLQKENKMNKNMVIGIVVGIVAMLTIVCALGAIYDYVPSVARVIWPNSIRHKNVEIHANDIFDNEIIDVIPRTYVDQMHTCYVLDEGQTPYEFTGWFRFDFGKDSWIYCQ